jgi:hypothetical protein
MTGNYNGALNKMVLERYKITFNLFLKTHHVTGKATIAFDVYVEYIMVLKSNLKNCMMFKC